MTAQSRLYHITDADLIENLIVAYYQLKVAFWMIMDSFAKKKKKKRSFQINHGYTNHNNIFLQDIQ